MRAALTLLPILAGCVASPRPDEGKLGETGLGDTGERSLPPQLAVAFSVALQRTDWGASVGRCQVEVAFLEAGQHDGLFDGAGEVIALPEEPDTCVFTAFDGDQAEGLWTIAGTHRAADTIWLHGDVGSLALELRTDGNDYTYALPDCDESVFPFAAVFDLEVPGWDGTDGLEGFEAEGAFVTGPNLHLTQLPGTLESDQRLTLPAGEDVTVRWSYDQNPDMVGGIALNHSPTVVLRNMHQGISAPFEALACMPATEGEMVIPASDLAQLTPNDDPSTGEPYLAFQVDAWYHGPTFETPWRSASRVLSVVTEGGIAILPP